VLAVELFLEGMPRQVLDEALDELDIDRAAFERDRAQVRRLIPRPLRHLASRLPGAMKTATSLARRTGADRRLRAWLTMEDSPA